MSSRFRSRYGPFGIGGWTPAVKVLIIACVVTFLPQIVGRLVGGPSFVLKFSLSPPLLNHNFCLWQLVTYIFLHDTNQFLHILFNMVALWMFGSELESVWGTRQFTK